MPCKQHQTPAAVLKASLTNTGMEVPEIDDGWMCPTSMKNSMLPVDWSCQDCRAYYVHRGIVLQQISFIGDQLDGMTNGLLPMWKFAVPMQLTRDEVTARMSFVLHIVLPDVVELYSSKNHTYWLIGSGLSGKSFPILICFSCPSDAWMQQNVNMHENRVFQLTTCDMDPRQVDAVQRASIASNPWFYTVSMSSASTDMDELAATRKQVEEILLTKLDLMYRQVTRTSAIAVGAPFAR